MKMLSLGKDSPRLSKTEWVYFCCKTRKKKLVIKRLTV